MFRFSTASNGLKKFYKLASFEKLSNIQSNILKFSILLDGKALKTENNNNF